MCELSKLSRSTITASTGPTASQVLLLVLLSHLLFSCRLSRQVALLLLGKLTHSLQLVRLFVAPAAADAAVMASFALVVAGTADTLAAVVVAVVADAAVVAASFTCNFVYSGYFSLQLL